MATFTEPVGPTVPLPSTALEIFWLFFTTALFQLIVAETNLYAAKVLEGAVEEKWTDINEDDVSSLLSLQASYFYPTSIQPASPLRDRAGLPLSVLGQPHLSRTWASSRPGWRFAVCRARPAMRVLLWTAPVACSCWNARTCWPCWTPPGWTRKAPCPPIQPASPLCTPPVVCMDVTEQVLRSAGRDQL